MVLPDRDRVPQRYQALTWLDEPGRKLLYALMDERIKERIETKHKDTRVGRIYLQSE